MTSVFVLGVDTNVLARFLTDDDPIQSPLSRQALTDRANQPIRVCLIALVELVWVLTRGKKWPLEDVFMACRALLASNEFVVEERELVAQALSDAQAAGCDLSDALIALLNRRAGCTATVTFDVDAQRLEHMVPVISA